MIKTMVKYYRQFDADYSLDVPAEGYGGWQSAELDFDPERIALVVVHANYQGSYDSVPGWYRAVEYIPRSHEIMRQRFEPLLGGIRDAGIPVVHMAGTPGFHREYPGYHRAQALPRTKETTATPIPADAEITRHRAFLRDYGFPGVSNQADIDRGRSQMTDFPEWSRPRDDECVIDDAPTLDAVCRHLGRTHLLYCGFAVNWCVFMSDGGMIDMSRRGYLCSIIEDATTAVENRESAREETHKRYGLWVVGLAFGYVFSSDSLLHSLAEATGA